MALAYGCLKVIQILFIFMLKMTSYAFAFFMHIISLDKYLYLMSLNHFVVPKIHFVLKPNQKSQLHFLRILFKCYISRVMHTC